MIAWVIVGVDLAVTGFVVAVLARAARNAWHYNELDEQELARRAAERDEA